MTKDDIIHYWAMGLYNKRLSYHDLVENAEWLISKIKENENETDKN